MKRILFLFFLLFLSASSYSSEIVNPEDAFTEEELKHIAEKSDYFFYQTMDLSSLIWWESDRKYSQYFLGPREFELTQDDVVKRALIEGFTVESQLQTVYQEKMKLHQEISDVLPHINITFGQGITQSIEKVFSGLFGFLIPSQWMEIANQKMMCEISTHYLSRIILDKVLESKLAYLNIHQTMKEFEILNYYLAHIRLLRKSNPGRFNDPHWISTITPNLALRAVKKKAELRLAFDELCQLIGLNKSTDTEGSEEIDLKTIRDFPSEIHLNPELSEAIKDHDSFVETVIEKSLEMKIVKTLFEISKVNIGVTALGGTASTAESSATNRHDAVFNFQLGYGTVPSILESISQKTQQMIDLKKEELNIRTAARKAYDAYLNSVEQYELAKKSLASSRSFFKTNFTDFVGGDEAHGISALFGVGHVIESEIELNDALHDFLRAKATIERYLLVGASDYLEFVPERDQIEKAFKKSDVYFEATQKQYEKLKIFFKKVRSATKLKSFFEEDYQKDNDLFTSKDRKEELKMAVQTHIKQLLKKRMSRRKTFYKVVEEYAEKEGIHLTAEQQDRLKRRTEGK